ncbi:Y-family DNA polymerase H isoform X2 [Wolffia australiana]
MPIARPAPQAPRVIAHVDLDCFYVQVEQRRRPELRGLPTAVVQYNAWKGGGLIAVGYEARKFGVKRSMRGDEAKMVCPDIQLVQVPVARGKADLNLYRDAGSEVVSILAAKGRCERASIDEVYLDLTAAAEQMLTATPPDTLQEIDEETLKSHVLGLQNGESVKQWLCRTDADHLDRLLACGAVIVAELRAEVLKKTSFTCSAGIAHNKMLAKLASGIHKPAQQTVVPSSSVPDLLGSLPINKMKQLGGKLGSSLQKELGVATVGDLLHFTEEKLQELYGWNTGAWLWNIARGINGDEVEGRLLPKSHGCGKTFPGQQALKSLSVVKHWLNGLCEELSERLQADLDKNKRLAHTLIIHADGSKAQGALTKRKFPSKSCPLRYGTAKIQEDAWKLFESGLREFLDLQSSEWAVTSLSVSASKIFPVPTGTNSIVKYFGEKQQSYSQTSEVCDVYGEDTTSISSSGDHLSEASDLQPVNHFGEENNGCHSPGMTHQTNKCSTVNREKGVCSILEHFHPIRFLKHFPPTVDGGTSGSKDEETESFKNEDAGTSPSHEIQVDQQREIWRFNVEDVDLSIVKELPPEIQQEVQTWIKSSKRTNPAKRPGSSISHYFAPVKKS